MSVPTLTIARLNLADVNSSLNAIEGLLVADFSGSLGSSRIGGLFFGTAQLTPAIVAANTTAEQTFTVRGLVYGSVVIVNKPTAQAGLGIVGFRVSATDTLAITFSNNTGVGITPTAGETYLVFGGRSA